MTSLLSSYFVRVSLLSLALYTLEVSSIYLIHKRGPPRQKETSDALDRRIMFYILVHVVRLLIDAVYFYRV